MSINEVNLLGNLGEDPELRHTAKGQAVTTLRLATNKFYRDKEGNSQKSTQWHRVLVWGKQAESCKEYLRKGRQIFVKGSLQTTKWEDKEGQTHYVTEVVADRVEFLGSNRSEENSSPRKSNSSLDLPFD